MSQKKQGMSRKSKSGKRAEGTMDASAEIPANGDRKRTAKAASRQSAAAGSAGVAAGPQAHAIPGAPSQFAGKTIAGVFGEMVWLLSRRPKYRELKLSDLEWLIMPPLLLRQFKLFYGADAGRA